MAVLYHTRVGLDLDGWSISYSCPLGLDGCSISYLCPLGLLWLFYIILVSSWTLIAVLYHTRVLLDLDGCSISYSCPLGH